MLYLSHVISFANQSASLQSSYETSEFVCGIDAGVIVAK